VSKQNPTPGEMLIKVDGLIAAGKADPDPGKGPERTHWVNRQRGRMRTILRTLRTGNARPRKTKTWMEATPTQVARRDAALAWVEFISSAVGPFRG
jgi:hypothetical protein